MAYQVAELIESAKRVLEAYAEGQNFKQALKTQNVTAYVFRRALRESPDLDQAYADAKESRGNIYASEVVDIADDPDIDPARARNMIDARKWAAAKLFAAQYGDKLDVTVQQLPDVLGALTDARSRLRHSRDTLDIADAEYVENNGVSLPRATDTKSGELAEPGKAPAFDSGIFADD